MVINYHALNSHKLPKTQDSTISAQALVWVNGKNECGHKLLSVSINPVENFSIGSKNKWKDTWGECDAKDYTQATKLTRKLDLMDKSWKEYESTKRKIWHFLPIVSAFTKYPLSLWCQNLKKYIIVLLLKWVFSWKLWDIRGTVTYYENHKR